MVATRVLRTMLVCLALALGAGACGSDDGGETGASSTATDSSSEESTPGSGSAPAGTPACAEVWKDGAELPRGYAGCADEDGSLVEPDRLRCESGQQLVRYDDRFYGVAGGTVHGASPSLEKDRGYHAVVRRCRA